MSPPMKTLRAARDALILWGSLGLFVAGLVLSACLPWWFEDWCSRR